MKFDLYIGIDYSGAKTADSRSSALQVYSARVGDKPEPVRSPAATNRRHRNWTRREIASWLIEQAENSPSFIAGIDHGFSFPVCYFQRYKIRSWNDFLTDFSKHWPTAEEQVTVESLREQSSESKSKRVGSNDEFRMTENWSSSAKSVFQFDVQGSVAKSTHAGIPWLLRIKHHVADRVHFWPFDGWRVPEGKAVIAEVYPSLFRNRYPRQERSCDQQDGYSIARWLGETNSRGFLDRYLDPPLTDQERKIAALEGWILGIT